MLRSRRGEKILKNLPSRSSEKRKKETKGDQSCPGQQV